MKTPRWLVAGIAAAGGALVLPVVAYVAGGQIVGPYPGPRGLASYLGGIYGDALGGHPLALALVLTPALVMLIWLARAWLHGRWRSMAAMQHDNSTKSAT